MFVSPDTAPMFNPANLAVDRSSWRPSWASSVAAAAAVRTPAVGPAPRTTNHTLA